MWPCQGQDRPDYELTKCSPHFTLTGELWSPSQVSYGVFGEYLGEKWPCYKDVQLYFYIFQVLIWKPVIVNDPKPGSIQGSSIPVHSGHPDTQMQAPAQIPKVTAPQPPAVHHDDVPLGVTPSHAPTNKAFYGIIFDAGSTGTRIHCFTFLHRAAGKLIILWNWPLFDMFLHLIHSYKTLHILMPVIVPVYLSFIRCIQIDVVLYSFYVKLFYEELNLVMHSIVLWNLVIIFGCKKCFSCG